MRDDHHRYKVTIRVKAQSIHIFTHCSKTHTHRKRGRGGILSIYQHLRRKPFWSLLLDHLLGCHPLLSIATVVEPSASLPVIYHDLVKKVHVINLQRATKTYFGPLNSQLLLKLPALIFMLIPQSS